MLEGLEMEMVNQGGPVVALYVLALSVLGSTGFWVWVTKRQSRGLNEAREGEVVVNAAASVVGMQQQIMGQLKVEMEKQAEKIRTEAAESMDRERTAFESEISSVKWRLEDMAKENQRLRSDLVEFKERCEHLELVNHELVTRNKELMARLEVVSGLSGGLRNELCG